MATAVSEVDVSQMAAPSLPGPVVSPTTLEEWDDDVIENTVGALIEEQSPPNAWRTQDLPNGFGSSLSMEQGQPPSQAEMP